MLNRPERFKILKFIRACYYIGCFPVLVNLSDWQLILQTSRRRTWLSRSYFGLFLLNLLYKIGTFVGACLGEKRTPLHLLIIHGILALGTPILIYWYCLIFIKDPSAFSCFLRLTLTGNIGGTVAEGRKSTKLVHCLKEYTLQDLAALYLPYMVAPIVLAIIGTGIFCPTIRLLLYAGLPDQYQTWLSFGILLLEELRFMLILYTVALPVWILQVISFDLVNRKLKLLIGSIGRTASRRTVERAYNSLRHIQLYISITNAVNHRYIIFSWKVLCIGACITTGYAAIAHFNDFPIFGVMYYVIVVDGVVIYTVSYDKAFKIPGLFREASMCALRGLRRDGTGDIQILKRQLRSIPPVGIKVGQFHVLERESTPTFVHYVLSHIVSMLVVFRG